jgi:diacylglycerol kinase (CTP)
MQRSKNQSHAAGSTLALRSDLHLLRKLWHFTMGMAIVLIYTGTGMSRTTGASVLGFFFLMFFGIEMLRLRNPRINAIALRTLGAIMRRGEESRLSGVPYYLAAAIIAVLIFPKTVTVLALLFLACGDPAASLVGNLYGDRSIRFSNGKSLIGTSAGVLVCALVAGAVLAPLDLGLGSWVALTLLSGLAGGLAEMVPLEIDDNFTIPVVSGFAVWLFFLAFGVPLV